MRTGSSDATRRCDGIERTMALLLATSLFSYAASADQRVLVDAQLASDFKALAVSPQASDGFWAFGTSDSMTVMLRYDQNGVPRFARFPPSDQEYSQIIELQDGGAMSAAFEDPSGLGAFDCKLRRLDATGNTLWISDIAQPTGIGVAFPSCSPFYVDGAGRTWLFPAGLNQTNAVLVNDDGTAGEQTSFADQYAVRAVANPSQTGLFVAGSVGRPDVDPTSTLATIWYVTSQGLAWTQSAPSTDIGSVIQDVAVAGDSTVWAFGNKGAQLYGMHVDSSGTLLWSGAFDTTVMPVEVKLAVRSDGGVSTLHWDPSAFYSQPVGPPPELSTFSSAGARIWSEATGFSWPTNSGGGQLALASASNGDILVALSYTDSSGQNYLEQARVDDGGSPLFALPAEPLLANYFQVEMLSDNTSLTVAGGFQHLARDGSALTAPDTSAVTTAAVFDVNDLLAPDGTTYLVVEDDSARTMRLVAYSNAGSPLWRANIPTGTTESTLGGGATLMLRHSDICVAGDFFGDWIVQCFALADGSPTMHSTIASGLTTTDPFWSGIAMDDDRIIILTPYGGSNHVIHHVLVDPSGNVVHDITPLQTGETWNASALNKQGQTFIATSGGTLVQLAPDGTPDFSVATNIRVSNVASVPDGSAILMTYANAPVLERMDSQGRVLWQTTLPSGGWNSVRSLRFGPDDIYFVLTSNVSFWGANSEFTGLVARVSLSTGSIVWSAELPYLFFDSPRLVLDPNDGQVISLASWNNQTQLRRFSMVDGTVLGGESNACDVDSCFLSSAILAPDGTLRMVLDTSDFVSGSAFELTTLENRIDVIFTDEFGF